MTCFKKLEKLVNMIKKYSLILLLFLLIPIKNHAFSEINQQQIYIGCYQNSKQYLGSNKAKTYCLCTIQKLGEKFNDEALIEIFKRKPEKIIKDTQFASRFCEKEIAE